MTFLLEARPEDSKDAVSRVDNSMIRLSSCVKIFRAAYDENLEYTNSHEAETNSTWGEASAHLNKIKERVWDVLSQYGSFKFKLQVLGLKTDLGQRFNLDKAWLPHKDQVSVAEGKSRRRPKEGSINKKLSF